MGERGWSRTRLERMHDILARRVEDGNLPGIVTGLYRHGEVHVDAIGMQDIATGAPMQRDTIFRIASMTKPVVAVATLILIEETVLHLDDPVDPWLPELADRRVLSRIDDPINDTVAATRAITVRDLLTSVFGFGWIVEPAGTYPIQVAMTEARLDPEFTAPAMTPDEWMARLGSVPNVAQPGERWMYHTAYDALGVLLERVTGMDLGTVLRERIFSPLGMKDTGFSVARAHVDRLATSYEDDGAGGFSVFDGAADGEWAKPPAFRSGGGGLVSTVDDYISFGRMLLNGGQFDGGRILARPTVELMTTDHITAKQKAASPFFPGFWDNLGWGFGVGMPMRRDDITATPGSFGWDGGLGTAWRTDPTEDFVGVFMTQIMSGYNATNLRPDAWALAYAAFDD
jgi:CubicO group peptidase (beta-lactamase class C family)